MAVENESRYKAKVCLCGYPVAIDPGPRNPDPVLRSFQVAWAHARRYLDDAHNLQGELAEATAKLSHSTDVVALQDGIKQLEEQIAELKNRI